MFICRRRLNIFCSSSSLSPPLRKVEMGRFWIRQVIRELIVIDGQTMSRQRWLAFPFAFFQRRFEIQTKTLTGFPRMMFARANNGVNPSPPPSFVIPMSHKRRLFAFSCINCYEFVYLLPPACPECVVSLAKRTSSPSGHRG